MNTRKDAQSVIHYNRTYNPYEDPQLVETQNKDSIDIDSKEAFNDAVKHQDIVAGYRRNRTLTDYPRRVRPWVRLYAIVVLILLSGSFIWNYVH